MAAALSTTSTLTWSSPPSTGAGRSPTRSSPAANRSCGRSAPTSAPSCASSTARPTTCTCSCTTRPPSLISKLVNSLKGVSARYLRQEHAHAPAPVPVGRTPLVTVVLRRILRRSTPRGGQGVHRKPETSRSGDGFPPGPEGPGFQPYALLNIDLRVLDDDADFPKLGHRAATGSLIGWIGERASLDHGRLRCVPRRLLRPAAQPPLDLHQPHPVRLLQPRPLRHRHETSPTTVDVATLTPRLVRIEEPGDAYTLHHSMIHSVMAHGEAVTLIVRGPAVKDRFVVTDRATGKAWFQYGAAPRPPKPPPPSA